MKSSLDRAQPERVQQGSGMGCRRQGLRSLQEGHWQEVGGCGAGQAVLLPQREPGWLAPTLLMAGYLMGLWENPGHARVTPVLTTALWTPSYPHMTDDEAITQLGSVQARVSAHLCLNLQTWLLT